MNELRTCRQQHAIEKLFAAKRVVLQWPTGMGKSYVGVQCIKRVLEEKPNARILLMVAEVTHKKNWCDEFTKHLGEFEGMRVYSGCTVECYASLKKYESTIWDMILFDEAHHLGSELRLDLLMTLRSQYILCLSATMKDEVIHELGADFGPFLLDRVTMSSAISADILPEPVVIGIRMELDEVTRDQRIDLVWGPKTRRVDFGEVPISRLKSMRSKASAGRAYSIVTQAVKYAWMDQEIEWNKGRWMRNGTEWERNLWLVRLSARKRWLGEVKTRVVKELLRRVGEEYNGEKAIIFCASVSQAEELGGVECVHSRLSDSENALTIDRFNRGVCNRLYAVGKLVEGTNLVGCRIGVIVQLDGEPRLWVQKCGRLLRHPEPVIFVPFISGTRDEEYWERVSSSMSSVRVIGIDEFLSSNQFV